MEWSLTLAKVFMVPMFIVEVLSEPTWGAADLPTGGDGTWPVCCREHRVGQGVRDRSKRQEDAISMA